MEDKYYLNCFSALDAIENLEAILNSMPSLDQSGDGALDKCSHEDTNTRKMDNAKIAYFIRAKRHIRENDDNYLDRVMGLGELMYIAGGQEYLTGHIPNCKRCLRTIKGSLDEKPDLDEKEIERMTYALQLGGLEARQAFEDFFDPTKNQN